MVWHYTVTAAKKLALSYLYMVSLVSDTEDKKKYDEENKVVFSLCINLALVALRGEPGTQSYIRERVHHISKE